MLRLWLGMLGLRLGMLRLRLGALWPRLCALGLRLGGQFCFSGGCSRTHCTYVSTGHSTLYRIPALRCLRTARFLLAYVPGLWES